MSGPSSRTLLPRFAGDTAGGVSESAADRRFEHSASARLRGRSDRRSRRSPWTTSRRPGADRPAPLLHPRRDSSDALSSREWPRHPSVAARDGAHRARTERPYGSPLRQARPTVPARGNIRGNIQIIRCVRIVRDVGTIRTIWHATDGYDTRVTRLRAWSGITGWRFESSSAHRAKAPHSGAFRVLDDHSPASASARGNARGNIRRATRGENAAARPLRGLGQPDQGSNAARRIAGLLEKEAFSHAPAHRLYERGRVSSGVGRGWLGPAGGWWWRAALMSLSPLRVGDCAKWEGSFRRRISKESRQAARRKPAPAGAKGWLRVSMCQIASVSLRESSIWATLGPRWRPRRRLVCW